MTKNLTSEGVVTVQGETYLSVERAAEYIGRKRASIFNYIKRYNLSTRTLPLQGKRKFLRQSDLDRLMAGDLDATPKDEAAA